jgi:hypothetical protein
MNDPISKPIIITDSSIGKQAVTAVQYIVTAVGAFLLGRGWIKEDTIVLMGLLIPVVVPAIIGMYKTWKGNEQKKSIVNDPQTIVPSNVAKVV